MFGKLKQRAERINTGTIMRKVVERHTKEATQLNTEEQLFKSGIDIRKQKLRPYAASTKRTKRRKGQPVDRTTLRDTGGFHKSFKVDAEDKAFQVRSFMELQRGFNLSEHLKKRYGLIYGLTDDNLTRFVKRIKPDFVHEFKAEF